MSDGNLAAPCLRLCFYVVARIGDPKVPHKGGDRKDSNKAPIVALVQRDGDVRTKVVANVSRKNLHQFIDENIAKGAVVNTDSFAMYQTLLWPIYRVGNGRHDVVNHRMNEYARRNKDGSSAHVNTCESFFSLISSRMRCGLCCGRQHHRNRKNKSLTVLIVQVFCQPLYFICKFSQVCRRLNIAIWGTYTTVRC
jgi:hypothetical protein